MAPSLTTLPTEVVRKIAGFLTGSEIWDEEDGYLVSHAHGVAQYTTISKQWQEVLEEFTFKNLRLTSSRLPQLASILTTRRLKYIHRIVLDIELPPFTAEGCWRLEDNSEKERNSNIADNVISTFFGSLCPWKQEQARSGGISLRIRAYAPTDYGREVDMFVYGQFDFIDGVDTTDDNSIDDDTIGDDTPHDDIPHDDTTEGGIAEDGITDNGIVEDVAAEDGIAIDHDSDGSVEIDGATGEIDINQGIGTKSFEGSFLDISTPLPRVECISTFTIGHWRSTRNLSAQSYRSLLQALPKLQTLYLHTFDIQHPEPSHRKAYIGFLSSLPQSLDHLRFEILDLSCNAPCRWPQWHTDYRRTVRKMTKDGIDVLSCTLREVSHGLTTLKIRGPIGPQFFWPLKDSKADTPYWPNLRSLGGFLYVYLPGGTWLFKHAALDGTSCEVCAWRPNTEALNELYLAVAKAVSRMPRLEIMALRTTNRPMFHDFRFKVIGRRAYLRWHSTPKFEPSDQVLHLWEKVVESRDLELDVASYRADEADIGGDEFGIEFIGEHELDDGLWNSHEEEAEDDVSDGHDDADFGASNSDGDSESSGDDDADSSDGGDAETGDDEN